MPWALLGFYHRAVGEADIFFSGHGLYYKQFTKEGFPNHPEAFLRGILDYDEDLSEQILAFSTESERERSKWLVGNVEPVFSSPWCTHAPP